MDKKNLTEADIRTKFITPALDEDKQGSWALMMQLLEVHYFTNGRVIVRGQAVHRGKAKKAGYILFCKPEINGEPRSVIDARCQDESGEWMPQAT